MITIKMEMENRRKEFRNLVEPETGDDKNIRGLELVV